MPQLTMPNIGEGVTEGTVVRWLKQQGDAVALDEPVVEVETDKAVVEIPSPFEGTLSAILVAEGETVEIGTPLADFDGAASAPEGDQMAPASPAPAVASQPASARTAATPQADVDAAGTSTNGVPRGRRNRQYSPVVLNLASEHGLDLALVRGTGIEGRVTRQDVLRYMQNPAANTVAPSQHSGVVGVEHQTQDTKHQPPSAPETAPTADQTPNTKHQPPVAPETAPSADQTPNTKHQSTDTTPLSATRRTIAAHMTEAHQTIPVAWMMIEADVSGLVALREREKAAFAEREGAKLTLLPFFVQAIVAALKEHPALNATYSDDGITLHGEHAIGIAVATERGLLVPVVRRAGDLSIAGLAHAIAELGAKAHDRKLSVEEMRGATFTVDNTGAFGSIASKPIVPVGQVAIITTEAVRRELRPDADGGFAPRSVMNLCISFDHRALDGAEAGAFMQSVHANLEGYRPDHQVH